MKRVDVTPLRKQFNSEIKRGFDLISKINKLKPSLPQKYVWLIVELSFLKIYLAWEQFLEETFLRYAMGGKTSTGYKVTSYINPRDKVHAQDLINEGKEYSNWTPSEVIKKASRFFKREPFRNALRPIITELDEMRTIRNKIVHGSSYSNEKFKTLVRSKISYAPRGITAGEFLLKTETNTRKTFFEFYVDFIINASKKIVP